MSDRPPRQPYRFGPIALFARFKRWHLTSPLWQVLLLERVMNLRRSGTTDAA